MAAREVDRKPIVRAQRRLSRAQRGCFAPVSFPMKMSEQRWSAFTEALEYKAWKAGVQCKKVNPAYTSTDCFKCGHRQQMALSQRTFDCAACGLRLCRDVNAAKNIRSRGFPGSGGTLPDAATRVRPLPSVGKTSPGLTLVARTDAAEQYAQAPLRHLGI